jgi:hypothetical protein
MECWWNDVGRENIIYYTRLVKKFPFFFDVQKFITMFKEPTTIP